MTPSFIVSKLRGFARVHVVAAIVLSIQMAAIAQTSQSSAKPDRGVRPNGTYSVSDIENINLINGNVNLSIPLASLPPIAGGKLSLTLRANYNGKIWDVKRNEVTTNGIATGHVKYVQDVIQQANNGGWSIGGSYDIKFQQADLYDFGWLGPEINDTDHSFFINKPYPQWAKVQLITPDGATHELRPLDFTPYQASTRDFLWGYYWETPDRVGGTMRYYSSDGSYIWAKINPAGSNNKWEVYLADGTRIIKKKNESQRIIDPNGNSILIIKEDLGGGITVTHFQDEMATGATIREIKYTHTLGNDTDSVEYQTGEDSFATVSILWGQKTVLGQTYNLQDHFNGTNETCERTARFDAAMSMIREIDLPPTQPSVQRKFTFSYNSDVTELVSGLGWWTCDNPGNPTPISQSSKGWGSLSQMTTPSGAQVNYSYELDNVHFLGEAPDAPRERISSKSVKQTDTNTTDTWTYFSGSPLGTVIGPDGSRTTEFAYTTDPGFASIYGGANGLGGLVYRTVRYLNNQPGVTVDRHWTRLLFAGGSDLQPGTLHGSVFNAVVDAEYTTLHDASGVAVQMSAKTFQYDYNGNLTSESDYDWFSPALIPQSARDPQGVPNGVPTGLTPVRVITNNYHNPAPVGSDPGSANVYAKRDKTTGTPLILNAPKEMTVGSSTATISKTRFHYDNNNTDGGFNTVPTIGNVTKVRQDRDGTWINTVHTYDVYGNVLTTTDPRGKTTTLVYDATTHAQPISVTVDPNDQTPGDELATTTAYDYSTGLVTSVTDPNGKITSISYANQLLGSIDPFGRPGIVTDPQGRNTVTRYLDNTRKVEVWSDLNSSNDALLKSRSTHDQLGRVVKTEAAEDGVTYTIFADSVYQQGGRITIATNPMRTAGATTDGWTRTTRDDLGRVVTVETLNERYPAGTSTGLVTTTYTPDATTLRFAATVTDQVGKVRRSITDGLGRLTRVDEPNSSNDPGPLATPVQPTSYTYDAVDNLTSVTQIQGNPQATQTRTFSYDSLKRLKQAVNPESGTINYTYDDNSNLQTKTDARGVITTYAYDGLNRVTTRTYSGQAPGPTTPNVTYVYDTLGASVNGKGRLTSVSSSVSSYSYGSYDVVGRVLTGTQTTDNQLYAMSYQYNLAGGMTSETYPSNKVVATEYDAAGRIAGVKKDATIYYAGGTPSTSNAMSYTAHGAPATMKLGNGKWEHTNYNSRLQPAQIGLGTSSGDSSTLRLDYTYGTTANNGNVQTQRIVITGSLDVTQNYTYDELNRLKTANESSGANWSQTYGYDRFGNRWVSASTGYALNTLTPQVQSAFTAGNNRLVASVYDTAGNQTMDGQSRSFEYDAENRQTKFNSTVGQYFYDGDGRRVKKIDSTGTTVFVYNVGGQLIAEYTTGTPAAGDISYLTTDHLGSTRVVTDSGGNVKARYDYVPFGEEIGSNIGARTVAMGYVGSGTTRQKFTQKERDNESGFDYFLARYHSSAQGRFTSTDPYNIVMETQYATDQRAAKKQFVTYLSNPQRWNRFPYALNNPLFYTDPTGEDVTIYYRSVEEGKDVGHIFIYVRNDETGESAYFDYVPLDDDSLLLPVDQRRIDKHASLTIETTAEQEQAILGGIKELQNNLPDWKYLTPNCISKCQDLLKQGGIDLGNSTLPIGVWREAVRQYGNTEAKGTEPQNWPSFGNPRTYNPGVSRLGVPVGDQPGKDYGHDPRGQARKVDRSAVNNDNLIRFRGGQKVP